MSNLKNANYCILPKLKKRILKNACFHMHTRAKCTKRWKQSSALKHLLETLLRGIRMRTGFTAYVIWTNTKVCSVINEPNQDSSRCVSFFKDSSALLNIWALLITSTLLAVKAENSRKYLRFCRFVHFACAPISIFGFHHKQCASDWKDSDVQ